MTGRENCRRAIEFARLAYVPYSTGVDLEWVRDGVRRWTDQWGTGWADDGHGAKTESHPLEGGCEALAGYAFPDPDRPGRFDDADKRLSRRGERYIQSAVWFTLFERLWMLRPPRGDVTRCTS